jgi:hypothetical protein
MCDLVYDPPEDPVCEGERGHLGPMKPTRAEAAPRGWLLVFGECHACGATVCMSVPAEVSDWYGEPAEVLP